MLSKLHEKEKIKQKCKTNQWLAAGIALQVIAISDEERKINASNAHQSVQKVCLIKTL